jgi:signal transduction histidine kinase
MRPARAPGSLRLRFLLAMLVWISAGLVVIGLSTSALFRRHVEEQFHDELEVHLTELAELTRLDAHGRPVLERPLSDPRYARPDSGFYWQVVRDGHPPLTSASITSGSLETSLAHQPDVLHRLAPGPTGPSMTYGFARPAPGGGYLHFLIATDERHLDAVIHAFDRELRLWLLLLALGGLGTGFLVVLYTLRPLRRLGRAVADVRAGRTRRMDGEWQVEIAPLVADLNGLLDINEDMVTRARVQAGNLAHSLRTSLAILTDEAETLARSQAGESALTLLEQSRRMARQLDWHLARSRAGVRHGARTELPDAVLSIAGAMERLHAGRAVSFTVGESMPVALAIEPEDFAEILSNLADNAGKWARSQVTIGWTVAEGRALIHIEDDGPGIAEALRSQVFDIGNRLDERTPGHGLGLAIARDLAVLHGGEIRLGARADARPGLSVLLSLDMAGQAEARTLEA